MRLRHALKIYALAVGACFFVYGVARLCGAPWAVAMIIGCVVPAVVGAAYLWVEWAGRRNDDEWDSMRGALEALRRSRRVDDDG